MTASGLSRPGRLAIASLALALGFALVSGAHQAGEAVGASPGRPDIVDFHPFHIAGRLAWRGRFSEAYDPPRMQALQRDEGGGRDVFMPFVYPPTFGLLLAPLALLPVGPACFLFGAATLALYLGVLRWLAGPWFGAAALVAAPALLIDLRLGQNGLLTGGLAGLAAGLALRGRSGRAGGAAGLLAFKPQLATGVALLFLVRRDARALAAGAAVAATAGAAALLLLGTDTAAAFRASLAYAARFMAAGAFPVHRMVSVYAALLSLRVPAPAALAVHAAAAAVALAVAAIASARLADRAAAAGLCLMSTAFPSPYLYDYDLPAFSAGLALALPALSAALAPRRLEALLGAVGVAGALGILLTPLAERVSGPVPALGGPILLGGFVAAAAALLRRPAGRIAAGAPAPAALP